MGSHLPPGRGDIPAVYGRVVKIVRSTRHTVNSSHSQLVPCDELIGSHLDDLDEDLRPFCDRQPPHHVCDATAQRATSCQRTNDDDMIRRELYRATAAQLKRQIPLRYPASEPARELVCDMLASWTA